MAEKETEMTTEHLQIRDMERQRKLLEQQIEELHSCKMKVQEQKIAEREEDEKVLKWGLQLKKEAEQLQGNYRKVGWIKRN